MPTSPHDRETLRRLAARAAELAALDIQAERTELIRSLNMLRPKRPVVLVFPEGGWRDLVTDADLVCADPLLRQWERHFRSVIFHQENTPDDQPLLATFDVRPVVNVSDFGIAVTEHRTDALGAKNWEPPVKTRADFQKLHPRRIVVDHAATQRFAGLANDLFGDLLQVRTRGMLWWTTGLTSTLIQLRGLEQMMFDMYDDPDLLDDMMAFLRDDQLALMDTLEREGALSLNNGPTDYVGSGGLGATDDLPAADFAGKVRLKDMWGLSESQETVGVSPELFERFVLRYQKPLMARFGLVCYGCCEPIDRRFDLVRDAAPNLRRVSVSPWSDRAVMAGKLTNRYVFSWKPNPSRVCSPDADWPAAEQDVRDTLAATRGCCVEMILKDTHTFHGDRSRPGRWARMARALAEKV